MELIKKLTLASMLVCASAASAQSTEIAVQTAENNPKYEFAPHWYLSVQGGAAYTRGEADFSDLISPAAALGVGYRFTPVFGLRVGASGWQAKGGWITPATTYKYKYVQGNVDAVFDLSALLCHFNPKRVLNVYAFLGAGVNYAFDNDEAVALADNGYKLTNLWREHRYSPVGRAGLGVNLRLSDYVAINVEGNANVLSDHFNSKRADNPDWQFNLLAGLTINLSKSYKEKVAPAPVVETYVPEEKPAPQPAPQPVKKEEPKPTSLTQNVFFLINSSTIRQSEEQKVDALVAYLNQYPKATVQITGYADAATGTAKYNARLSAKRAEAVAKMLQAKGIDAGRIKTDSKGDTVQPFSNVPENRVTICVATE